MGRTAAAGIQAGAQVATAGMQLAFASKQARRARQREAKLNGEMEEVRNSRPDIINPYEGIEDLGRTFGDASGVLDDQSSLAIDTSGGFSNPFANIGVATGAAEFAAEQADISLANTLDTLAATGASAGGATALAQAALQSKRGISNDIQKQEMQNAQLKAQGEQNLQQRVASEQARVQGVQVSEGVRLDSAELSEAQRAQAMAYQEGQRLQNAEAMGAEYMFSQEERRTIDDLNRLNSQITGAQQAQQAAAAGGMTALGNLGQGLGNLGASLVQQ